MNTLIEYLKYKILAKGPHGIHSPFVYTFVSECLKTNMSNNFVLTRKKLFKSLKNDTRTLKIVDFGAGSKKLNDSRSVNKIFLYNSSHGKYGSLLHKIVQFYQPKKCLELGTSIGVGTFCMAFENKSSEIFTVEGDEQIFSIANETFTNYSVSNVKNYCSTFEKFLSQNDLPVFDLVFIDGHHDGKALLHYFDLLTPYSHNDTLFILDDIRWSTSMYEAWKELVNRKDLHLTMDLFRMGIVIRRAQQEKEHFVIKY